MQLYLRLAWRNMWRHRRRTLLIVGAIGLVMCLMMFYDGLITGFNDAIYGNAIKVLGGNVQVHASGYHSQTSRNPLIALANDQAVMEAAAAQPQVAAAARRIMTGGMVSDRKGAFAVSIAGIEPDQEKIANMIAQNVKEGRFLAANDQDVILIGKGLATAMEVTIGDRVTLAGQATHNQMRQRTLTVGGIYDLNMPDLEKQTVYISLAEAQDLYGLSGQSTEVVLYLKTIGPEAAVITDLKSSLPGNYEYDSWQTLFPDLEAAINTKSGVMNMFSIFILVIAAIGILNMLLMAVYERTREIGVLGALGMKPGQISWLFVLEGAMIGLVGLAFGIGLGLIINYTFSRVGMDYSQFTSMSSYFALISGRVYTSLGTEKLLSHSLVTIVICILAALYPAYEAAQNEPAKSLHFV
jgi:ABC-type lipoprotein release transport system permease subunit